ncbi:FAD-binding domain-containing protein [Tropicimonas sp. S265A]|uniref:FAD-binding domain-containing protein n=1 Tax=Tropicimonas sp. S265A TaxID=3415134 RepID=UPI003C7B6050
MEATTLYWLKRDLRVEDNPALTLAAARGRSVIPVYIAEPDGWAQPDASARQWDFVAECLHDVAGDFARLGVPLVVRVGEAVSVLSDLCASHAVAEIISHEETGNGWSYARDRAVAAWARGSGVAWTQVPQIGVVRRLASRDGWAGLRDAAIARPQDAVPQGLRGVSAPSDPVPTAAALGLAPDPCPDRQRGGRAAALHLLGGFLTERGQDYRRAMSSPLAGETACSRLSPHLAFGTLSVREAAQAGAARKAETKGARDGWAAAMKSFEARLAWRDHFTQKLEDEPALEVQCLHPAYEGLRPRDGDAARFAAWADGQTGLPFVDACMRYLTQTGWLNFRMRSMLVAVASYHLWLDWRQTGPVLARRFTDYEPGIHWSQMQMQSGTTGMNTVRIYNPVKQGHDQDPTGAFTRRWVPELADVPDAHLQEPWLWEGAGRVLDRIYPAPIVDIKAAAAAARDRVWAVRRAPGFAEVAARVIDKHASRKDRAGRFVNDRAPRARGRRKASDTRQMSLDL